MTDETFRKHSINYIVSRPDEQLRPVDCSNGIIRLVMLSHGEAKKNIVVVSTCMVVSMAFWTDDRWGSAHLYYMYNVLPVFF